MSTDGPVSKGDGELNENISEMDCREASTYLKNWTINFMLDHDLVVAKSKMGTVTLSFRNLY